MPVQAIGKMTALKRHILQSAARILGRSSTFRAYLHDRDSGSTELGPIECLRAALEAFRRVDFRPDPVLTSMFQNANQSRSQLFQDIWVLGETKFKQGGYSSSSVPRTGET